VPSKPHERIVTVDHKWRGIMYIATSLSFSLWRESWPLSCRYSWLARMESSWLRTFTVHGTTVVFFVGFAAKEPFFGRATSCWRPLYICPCYSQ
jgi:heme/copper-type cytochrome/quinol oxidase subunit 1